MSYRSGENVLDHSYCEADLVRSAKANVRFFIEVIIGLAIGIGLLGVLGSTIIGSISCLGGCLGCEECLETAACADECMYEMGCEECAEECSYMCDECSGEYDDDYDDDDYYDDYYGDSYYDDMGCWEEMTAENLEQADDCASCEGIDCFGRRGCFASDGCGDCEHCAGTMYYSITIKVGDTEKKLEISEEKTSMSIYYPSNVSSNYYRFLGYYDKEEGGTQYVDSEGNIVKKLKNNMTLYGHYEEFRSGEDFIFDLRLAELGMPDETISLQVGGSMSILPIAAEKEGYDFVGWYLNGELVYEGNIREGERFHLHTFGFGPDVSNGPYTLTAKYTPKKYVVTFILYGSEYKLNAQYNDTFGKLYNEFYYKYNSSLQYEESFFGWGTSETTDPEHKVTETTKIEQNTTLYAIFRQPVWVKFHLNRWIGDEAVISVRLREGQPNVAFNKLEELAEVSSESVYPGYKFVGWFSSASGSSDEQAISGISNVTSSISKNYYARWKTTDYTLKYHVMHYDTGVSIVDYEETYSMSDSVYNLVSANKVYHNVGYEFNGWCLKEDCSDTPIMSLPAGTYGSKDLYAKFTPKSYGLNLVGAGGTINGSMVATDNFVYGSAKDLPVPYREGYNFLGWYYGDKKVSDENGHVNKFTFASLGLENNETSENNFANVRIQLDAKWDIKKFTVTFVDADGYIFEEQEIEWNKNATLPTEPKKEGYTFNYWMKEDGGEFAFSTQITKDWTITAKFTINKYTVAFIIRDVPTIINNVEWGTKLADVVAKISADKYPDKTRYKLLGWYESMDENATKYNDNTLIKENKTIYAHFEEALAVHFNEIAITKYWFTGATVNFPTASKTGYDFIGWCDSESLTSNPITTTQEVKVTKDMNGKTYYPKFKAIPYNISYMVDGVEYERDTYTIAEVKTLIAPGDRNEPKKAGYTFTGWLLNGTKVDKLKDTTGDKTVIAQFTANEYTITLRDEDGSQLYDDSFNAMKKKVTYDQKFNLGVPPSGKTGYHFVGWSWEQNNKTTVTSDTGASNGVYKKANDQNAYAVYEKNVYTFTWVGGDQGNQTTTQTHFDTKVSQPITPSKKGYAFVGWYKDQACTTEYNFNHEVVGPETIYAKFAINSYKIDFMINDDVVYSATLEYNSSMASAINAAKAYVTAYETDTKGIFQYWATDAGKTYGSTSLVPAEYLKLKAVFDMPVYARFIERTGVEKTYGPYYYTKGDTIPSYTPKRNGYTFDGWYKDNAQHQNFPITLTANTASAVTYDFYAQWKANTYTITYYIDGVYSHQETYSMSEADNGGYNLNVPNKLGHVFSGWKINNSGAVITEINNTGVAEEDKTYGNLSLYGTFEKATYSITFISGGEIVKVVYVQYGDTLQSQNSWVGTNGSKLAVPAGKNGFLGFQDQYGNQLIDQNGNWINGGTYTWTDNIELTAWWY